MRTSYSLFIYVMCVNFQCICNPHDFVKTISFRMTFNVNNDSNVDSDIDVED